MNTLDITCPLHQGLFSLMPWQTQVVRAAWGNSTSLNSYQKDLIPVSMQMHSTDNHDIPILRATILRLSGKDQLGTERITRQITYITNSTDKLFLSREACIDLGIISVKFPTVGEVPAQANHPTLIMLIPPRIRPPQTKPPPLPTNLPYHATEGKLKKYLLDYYSSSTFNICKHQPLPMMVEPPLWIMIDPTATPTVYNRFPYIGKIMSKQNWTEMLGKGFWNLSLLVNQSPGPEDHHYTTFITSWDRYRYCTAPQKYITSGDRYSRCYDKIISSRLQTKCIDDTLLWSNIIENCFFQTANYKQLDIRGKNEWHRLLALPETLFMSIN